MAVAIDGGESLATESHDATALSARFDGDFCFAPHQRHFCLRAERCVRERDVQVVVQVLTVALKRFVRDGLDDHEQVSRHAAHRSAVAFSAHAQLHAVLDAGGDLDGDHGLFADHAPFIRARRALLHRLPAALALGAGARRLHLAEDGVLDAADLPRASARLAIPVFRTFGLDLLEDLDLLFDAAGDLFQGQLDLDAQVGALHAPTTTTAAARTAAEGAAKDVAELAEDVLHVHPPETGTAARSAAQAVVTEAVVLGALLVVLEHFIGLCGLLELLFRRRVARVFVRVVFEGQFAVGLLDIGTRGLSVDP